MKAEYLGDEGHLQRDSAEREEYAGVRSIDHREAEEADGAGMLERILDREKTRTGRIQGSCQSGCRQQAHHG